MPIDWSTLRAGHPVAAVSAALPAAPEDWTIVRLFGGRPIEAPSLLGAIHRRGREALLLETRLLGFAADRFRGGLRRRILGEDLLLDPGWAAIEPLQHLSRHRPGRTALVIDAVEEADPTSLTRLRQIVWEADRLEFAIVLGFSTRPEPGPAADLLRAVEHVGEVVGDEVPGPVEEATAEPIPEPEPKPKPDPGLEPEAAYERDPEPGDRRAFVEGLLHAAEEAEAAGEVEYAWVHGLRALGEARALPSAEALVLEGRIRTCLGRVQAGGAGAGGQFSLPVALEQLDAAVSCLAEGPVLLRSEARHALALAAYELGEDNEIDHGIEELVTAVQELGAEGHDLAAARLLNDLAALLLSRGDPDRAQSLLGDSRRLIAAHSDHPVAEIELAETEHLLGRLPLHVVLPLETRDDAAQDALEHVARATRSYAALGLRRPYAHTLETRARLLMMLGRGDEAGVALTEALPLQEQLGDALGLARSSAALADLLLSRGRPGEALAALNESVRVNLHKGSRTGMAANLEALGRLEDALPAELRPELDETTEVIRDALQRQLRVR